MFTFLSSLGTTDKQTYWKATDLSTSPGLALLVSGHTTLALNISAVIGTLSAAAFDTVATYTEESTRLIQHTVAHQRICPSTSFSWHEEAREA